MICAFSGHRPQRLPWGEREQDPRCIALKLRMEQELRRIIQQEGRLFLCGMARGCDTYFAEEVLRLRTAFPEIQFWAILPCRDQANRWSLEDQKRHAWICQESDRVVILQEAYSTGCMLRRNHWLTEHADCVMTVYDGGSGGTAWVVHEARRKQLPIIPLWV